MSTLGPVVRYPSGLLGLHPSGVPSGCRGRIRERSRLEWRLADGGDPLALVERFLTEHGLPVADLSRQRSVIEHDTESICGAAVLLCGGTHGPPSPAPAVPDVVVIVY